MQAARRPRPIGVRQEAAQVGIAHAGACSSAGESLRTRAIPGWASERMRRRLEAHDHADRPRADLRVGGAALGAHAVNLVERLAPQLGLGIDLTSSTDSGRPAAWPPLERLELARTEVGIDLQHAAAGAAHALGQARTARPRGR